jgi:peptidyl-prolyl cis-trans isomerase A (cyclophilin A)
MLLVSTFVACLDKPPGAPEPAPEPPSSAGGAAPEPAAPKAQASEETPPPPAAPETPVASPDGGDPLAGKFGLADATKGLEGAGSLMATIKTNHGEMRCKLFDDKAPITVANFVGLARGVRPYKSTTTRGWAKKPLYDGTTFHRVIKGFMIQGGDPEGTGMGQPGYVIPDEIWQGAKHDHAGQLCMANRGPNTNGAQFFITDAPVPRLDGKYTIFGDCTPTSVVHEIASVPKNESDRPDKTVRIDKVEISRGE